MCVSIFCWSVWCNELRSVDSLTSYETHSEPHPSWRYAAMPMPVVFQASATYFALDESCSMLYLRLTNSTTLKPKGRYSVPKTWEFPRFLPEVPMVMAASVRVRNPKGRWLALFTTFPTPNEVLKTRPNKKKHRHTRASNVGTMFLFKIFLFWKIDRLPLVTLNFVWLLTMKSSHGWLEILSFPKNNIYFHGRFSSCWLCIHRECNPNPELHEPQEMSQICT